MGFSFDTSNLERPRKKGTGSWRKAQKAGILFRKMGVKAGRCRRWGGEVLVK